LEEIDELVNRWPAYKGSAVTAERVRSYLDQFSGAENQRFVFRMLQALRFCGTADKRKLLAESFQLLQQHMHRRDGSWAKSQIVLSYIDGAAKSGAMLAREFADV